MNVHVNVQINISDANKSWNEGLKNVLHAQ